MSEKIFEKTIGQMADSLNIKTHTVRYWVDNFPHIKIKIGKGERRYFDKESEEELKKVKNLIQNLGMSIEGVKSLVHYGKIKLGNVEPNKEKNLEINTSIKRIDSILDRILIKITNLCQD